MNDIQENGTRQGRGGVFGDPGQIAPHVEKGWRDDFIIELRLLGVAGDRIGDALVTVDSHVAESGEGALEAFGEPVPYAREIARSSGKEPSWSINSWTVLGNVAGLVGMLAAVRALTGWLEGGPLAITVGDGVGLLLLLALMGAVLRWPTPLIRVAVEHRVAVSLLTPVVLIGAFVGVFLLLRDTWFEVGVLPVALVAVVLMATSVVAAWIDAPPDGDQIVAPGQSPRPGGGARIAGALILPVLTLLLLGLTWGVHLLG
ncbi:hypothetical protein [Ornithinimicrobium pekingense]|uniref:hypothetical protein n=1 Tax=Ornithinimicrobium pekingense TaxID=384677 RepID=UPI0003B30A7A|nr:hypothetical protein [Ornithinimicrobium pekingense]